MADLLNCIALTKTYGKTEALLGVDLTLTSGRIVGLLGPNGSGKTTLIKLIAGLLTPTSGHVTVDGMDIGKDTKAVVSYLPERAHLPSWMTVIDCLDAYEDFYADFDRARATEMLMSLEVPPDKTLKTLSKGTREKVQLVMVMSRRARLYLLDEPIAGVDPAARDYILNTIIKNYESDATILLSTHLISDIENVLDEFVFLKDGRVTMHSTTDNVRSESGKSIDELFREVFKC